MKGNFPSEIHIHVKRFDMKSLPTEGEKIDEWCKDRWREKEFLLKDFYEKSVIGFYMYACMFNV